MKKISEVIVKNGIVKYYRCESVLNPVEFLESLVSKGWEFDKVFMKRDAEMDMQFGIGYYTLAELKESQASFAYGAPCQFTLEATLGSHVAQIHFSDDSAIVYLVTAEPDFELEC
jgi:hypothetical protein